MDRNRTPGQILADAVTGETPDYVAIAARNQAHEGLADAINRQDFQHPFEIVNGRVVDAPAGVFAPDVYHDEQDDIDIQGNGWHALTGYTNQYRYNGAVLHVSETTSGLMAADMGEASDASPGRVWALAVVECIPEEDEEESEPAGWAILYRDPESEPER